MQEIKIYDFNFNLLASDFKCVSFDWDIRYNSIGTFEGVFTLDSPVCDVCSKNEFTVCVQGENQGIVTRVNVENDRIVLSGRSMNYILEKRICMPFSSSDYGMDVTATQMVAKLVETHCGDFMEVLAVPDLELVRRFARYEARPLSEIVSEILATANCGHFVKFNTDEKKWQFGCLTPVYTDIVLSKPDNSLENGNYVRNTDTYSACGLFKQKAKFMGSWDAAFNEPMLLDNQPDNFAKAYYISETGEQFGKIFNKGMYLVCRELSGRFFQDSKYDDFWYRIHKKDVGGSLAWECVLSSEDIADAKEELESREIDENITAITRGVNQRDLKIGDVIEIRLTKGEDAIVFTRQIKKIIYHYQWGDCFVKPVFYKMKENEDE